MDLSNENIIYVKGKYLDYIKFKRLDDFGIKHAYTLKNEGLDFKSPKEEIGEKSYRLLCKELDLNYDNLIRPDQKHTSEVKCIDRVYSEDKLESVDGVLTNKKNIILSTTNGDCIVYLLYDPVKNVIGSVHSGWRGTVKRIIENTIHKMIENYNSNPEDIIICIAPSIRKCHFEVEDDVKEIFEKTFEFTKRLDEVIFNGNKEGKYYIDTVHLNNILLENLGIKKENIIDSGLCSVCNSNIIGSYRVQGANFTRATGLICL